MGDIRFNTYYKYEQLMEALRRISDRYPHLVGLDSMGESYEGRTVPVVTMTAPGGRADTRPAMYVDGNMHAGEVTASMACLYLIKHLARGYESDRQIEELLHRRTFYIAPRVNPDGAEKYLTTPHHLRSSVRPYPNEEIEDGPGLRPDDVDGDGRIRTMRVRDDARGGWKVSSRDPRLMVRRLPDDREGPFYHLYQEGYITDYEGYPFEVQATPWGLDTNRNFPSNWSTDLKGGGPYPVSEPEVKNVVDFILRNRNIAGVQAFHTSGGILFRSPYVYPDEEMNRVDYAYTVEIARRGTEYTGYPDVSSYSGPYAATIVDWAYETQGLIAYTPELWDLNRRAGIERVERTHRPPAPGEVEEQGIKLLQYSDRNLAGKGFADWHPVQHPQLGEVEVGGWEPKFFIQNPPPELLQAECRKIITFPLAHAESLPEVSVDEVKARQVSPGVHSVSAVISNRGYLPTSITEKALELDIVDPVTARIVLPPGASLLSGGAEREIGHLQGYASTPALSYRGGDDPSSRAKRVRWTVEGLSAGAKVMVSACGQRSGSGKMTVSL